MDVKEKTKSVQQNLGEKEKDLLHQVLSETDSTKRDKAYGDYIKKVTPKRSYVGNVLRAWLVGGIICVIGQGFLNLYTMMTGDKELAASYTTLSLILISVVLTGCNIYQKLACFAGAGSVVPITGFANSVAAPAIEFKQEGWVFGVGCKIFTIAGPVILYGVIASWALGVVYWVLKMCGVM